MNTVESVPLHISRAIWSCALQTEQPWAITGIGVVRGCIGGLHPEGVAIAGPCSEAPVQGCDAGELWAPGVPG